MECRLTLAGLALATLSLAACDDPGNNDASATQSASSTADSVTGTADTSGETTLSSTGVGEDSNPTFDGDSTTNTTSGGVTSTSGTNPTVSTTAGDNTTTTEEDAGDDQSGDESSCPGDKVMCEGTCIDPLSNDKFCGAIGNCEGMAKGKVCEEPLLCIFGKCRCDEGLIECDGKCIDPDKDEDYCGASGNCRGSVAGDKCGGDEACVDGECIEQCGAETVDCDGKCVNPDTDPRFCGVDDQCMGGNRCKITAGEKCEDGECVETCATGKIKCKDACIDPDTSAQFCGAVDDCEGSNNGDVCTTPDICIGGVCGLHCPGDLVECGTECVDTNTHANFCGADDQCMGGDVCTEDEQCKNGRCEPSSCETLDFKREPTPPNVMLVLDKSKSMNNNWEGATPAQSKWKWLYETVENMTEKYERRINFGVKWFPKLNTTSAADQCSIDTSANVDVEFVDDVKTAPTLPDYLAGAPGANGSISYGGTPGGNGIKSAIAYIRNFADDSMPGGNDNKNYIIFIADGKMECDGPDPNSGVDNQWALAEAKKAYEHPDIERLFAIAIAANTALKNEMDLIARAGAGVAANDTSVNAIVPSDGDALEKELEAILGEITSCEIEVERPPNNPAWVLVTNKDGKKYKWLIGRDTDGEFIRFKSCAEAEAAGVRNGWVWTDSGDSPTNLELCGTLCAEFKASGDVGIEYLCRPDT